MSDQRGTVSVPTLSSAWKVAAAGGVATAGALSGVAAESLLTPIQIESDLIPAYFLLSPLTITLAGSAYAPGEAARLLFMLLGFLAVPAFACCFVWSVLRPSATSYFVLFGVCAFYFLGLLHKHYAFMSIT